MKWLRVLGIILLSIVVIALLVVYKQFDPSQNIGFPKCPSLLLTGYQCAGCGSQRAIHHLLNFELKAALGYNPLVVFMIGYVVVLGLLEYTPARYRFRRIYNILTGRMVIIVLITTIIFYSIIRNL